MSIKRNIDEIKEEVNRITNGEYEVLSNVYINNKTKIKFLHNKCGNEFEMRTNDFLSSNHRCPFCSYKNRKPSFVKTDEQYKREVKKLTDNEYDVLGNYTNNKEKILHIHKTCGTKYLVRPNDFLQGYRCPNCSSNNSAKGIKIIEEFLNKNNINYVKEKTFDSLIYIHNLKFDYYLPEFNLLIEFDGQQHFVVRGNTKFNKDMSVRVKRDWIKNIWCNQNNIRLLRIPYSISPNSINKILTNIIYNEIDIKLLDKSNIYFDNNTIYNQLKYYTQRNSIYFSLYSNEIEDILRNFN